jgi:hypothetical protein
MLLTEVACWFLSKSSFLAVGPPLVRHGWAAPGHLGFAGSRQNRDMTLEGRTAWMTACIILIVFTVALVSAVVFVVLSCRRVVYESSLE